jgi:hypothetical protein
MTITEASSKNELEIESGGCRYVIRIEADRLQAGRLAEDGIAWLPMTKPLSELGGEARRALEQRDVTNAALLIGLKWVVASSPAAVLTNPR